MSHRNAGQIRKAASDDILMEMKDDPDDTLEIRVVMPNGLMGGQVSRQILGEGKPPALGESPGVTDMPFEYVVRALGAVGLPARPRGNVFCEIVRNDLGLITIPEENSEVRIQGS